MSMDITRLSYWLPKLEAAKLPVPRTILVYAEDDELNDVSNILDYKKPEGAANELAKRIKTAADTVGYPCFLRTDHTSGKHDWERTCFIANPAYILPNLIAIAEYWELANMAAPPCDVWAVRELLPTIPIGVCRGYGNMPICREFRFFVDGSEIKCWHPYWPWDALKKGGAAFDDPAKFSYTDFSSMPPDEEATIKQLASAAGAAVGGAWSVDLLETRRGWFITDMAEAHKSFHWEGCPEGKPRAERRGKE